MEEKLKLNNIHIVLFFRNIIEYNSLELANRIFGRLPQLGQPNIFNLPNDVPNEIRIQAPKIMFNNSKNININLTIANLELNISLLESFEELKNIIGLLYDSLEEQGIQIQAVGSVHDYISFDCNFELIKNTFYKDELLESDLANSSWYKKENNLNIWKLLNVEEKNDKKILSVRVDINNKGNLSNMTKEEVNSILKLSSERADTFKKELLVKIGE